jgi:Protein of unknown function (DUF3562)
MESEVSVTSLQPGESPADADGADVEIKKLARETDTPVEVVQDIYISERTKLDQTARIKTYVSVLIHRQVKARLREPHT